jgi:hypothetical protein
MANRLINFDEACAAMTSDINRLAAEHGVSPFALTNALAEMVGSPVRIECHADSGAAQPSSAK